MRGLVFTAAALLAGTAASAAEPPPLGFISAAEIAALAAKAKAERKPDQPTLSQTMLKLGPYDANLEYREAVGPASAHLKEGELFYVVEGSATLTTGGRITDETRPNPDNRSGKAIEGGASRQVGKGDLFIVPEGVPHWFSAIEGTVVLMSLHLPRG